jgi:molecular chaperone DnaK
VRRTLAFCVAIFTACTRPGPDTAARVVVEDRSPAIGSGLLVEDIGIETLGGVFTVLLARGVRVPASKTEVFSTATDNQNQIEIRLYRGGARMAAQNISLGRFVVTNIPAAPRGLPNIEVTFRADGNAIALEARDRGGAQIRLVKREAVEQREADGPRR